MCILKENDKEDDVLVVTWRRCELIRIWLLLPWNAFIDGLGLGDTDSNSDNMCIGSCAQLLGGGSTLQNVHSWRRG